MNIVVFTGSGRAGLQILRLFCFLFHKIVLVSVLLNTETSASVCVCVCHG